jgi:hypothetical protein
MKSIYKIIFFTFIIIGSVSYDAKAAIVYANDYSTKTDTVTGIVSKLTKSAIKWSSDNITKTTTYTYADKTTYVVVATVQPTTSSSVSGIIKTKVSTYGNGKVVTTKETATLVTGSVTYNLDYSTKSSTYRFLNSSTIVVTSLLSKTAVKWATDNVTRTSTYTYADRTTYVVTVTVPPTVTVSWAADHITKTTLTTYGNGKTSSATTTINPTSTTPALTNAVYPGDWTTTGTVTPPNVSSKTTTYGDGYTSVAEDGTSSKPFLQTTLSGLSISDPSKYVTSNTTTYDLRWGTPDKNGPGYVTRFPNYPNPLTIYGVSVQGYGSGPIFTTPSADVLAAWNNGWTGNGKNILTVDYFSSANSCGFFNVTACHGITTSLISGITTAPGATKYLLDWNGTDTVRNFNGTTATPTSMNVVNLSYTYVGQGAQTASNQVANFLKSNYQSFNLSNAVITKSAGNSSVTSNNDILSKTLAYNSSIAPRLLIVGAVSGNGTTSSPVNISYYSNTAGTDLALANRFVLANGNAPWSTFDVKINNSVIPGSSSNMGTSYAAPLVAGYAAIIQQKFPGLNAANTSNIILDTARYDTLTCYPSCDTFIYGKGEASLSRALAPVGRLR